MVNFKSIKQIKTANWRGGYRFFDLCEESTTKIINKVYREKYFIDSTMNKDENARRYTVRMVKNNGQIVMIGKFAQFSFLKDAEEFIKNLKEEIND